MTLPLFDVERHDRDASQWFTPSWLAKRLIAWCGSPAISHVLEPSAGGEREWVALEYPPV